MVIFYRAEKLQRHYEHSTKIQVDSLAAPLQEK